MSNQHIIKTEAELENIIGEASEAVQKKVVHKLDESMMTFIKRSPLVLISTIDGNGAIDISPKGDESGFIHIDDAGHLFIPERPGNKLAFGFKNLLRNSQIGLIFIVPKLRETLRVKGSAILTKDPVILDRLQAKGKPAILCTEVHVEECFFHCGKAMIRSNLWKPETWQEYNDSLIAQQITSVFNGDKDFEKAVESQLEQSYRDNLY